MNATIQFTCPQCSHTMELPATVEGKQGKCPSCSATVTVSNNAMVDLASLQQQPIPEQTKPSPTQPVQQPAATTDVPLEMGAIAFAEENLTPGETILHGGRFYPYYTRLVIGQVMACLVFVVIGLVAVGIHIEDEAIAHHDSRKSRIEGELKDLSIDDIWAESDYDEMAGMAESPSEEPEDAEAEESHLADRRAALLESRLSERRAALTEELDSVELHREPFWFYALLFVGLPFCGALFILWVQYRWAFNKDYKTEFVLTNHRLIAKWGFLRTVIREIQLEKIESVNYGQTFRERWFGIGRLTVRGTGGGKVGKFKYLMDALEFRRRILAQIDRRQT